MHFQRDNRTGPCFLLLSQRHKEFQVFGMDRLLQFHMHQNEREPCILLQVAQQAPDKTHSINMLYSSIAIACYHLPIWPLGGASQGNCTQPAHVLLSLSSSKIELSKLGFFDIVTTHNDQFPRKAFFGSSLCVFHLLRPLGPRVGNGDACRLCAEWGLSCVC